MSYSIVGEQILKYRKARGMTQRELGEAIGVTSSAVSQWESGGTPDISLLPALSDELGVTVDALFGRDDTRREDMEDAVGKYIASLPEEKRLERIASLARRAALAGCANRVADALDFDAGDSEMTNLMSDGYVTAVMSGGQSFLSAAWCKDGSFADLMPRGGKAVGLFSALASQSALAMLSKLYGEAPRHRTAGVLAKLAGIPQGDAENILRTFLELELIEELAVETENGCEKSYAVNKTRTAIPILAAAHMFCDQNTEIRVILENRYRGKGDE